jgi:hypothetical protein
MNRMKLDVFVTFFDELGGLLFGKPFDYSITYRVRESSLS